MNRVIKNNYLFSIIIFALTLFMQFELIKSDPILERDDQIIIENAKLILHPIEYLKNLVNGNLTDLQPIRDLSLAINFTLERVGVEHTYHLINYLIFLIMLITSFKLISKFETSPLNKYFIILIIAVHPVLQMNVAWISARKHLLSVLFFELFMLHYLKHEKTIKTQTLSVIFSILSFFSNQMFVFIPIFLILNEYRAHKKVQTQTLITALIGTTTFFLNWIFYTKTYGIERYSYFYEFQHKVVVAILSFGRSFFQVVLPLSPAAEYDYMSYKSYLGLVLFIFVNYLIYRKNKSHSTLYSILFFLCIFQTLSFITLDSYLIAPLILTLTAILTDVVDFKKAWHQMVVLSYVGLCLFFSSKSVSMWKNDNLLWESSYKSEGGATNTLKYAMYIAKQDSHLAMHLLESVLKVHKRTYNEVGLVFKDAIVMNSNLSFEQKSQTYLNLLKKYPHADGPFMRLSGAQLLFENQAYEEGFNIIREDILTERSYSPIEKNIKLYLSKVCEAHWDPTICPLQK